MAHDKWAHTRAVIRTGEAVGLAANDVDEIVTLYMYELRQEIENWKEREDA